MYSWPVPEFLPVPGQPVPLRLFDSADQQAFTVPRGGTLPAGERASGATVGMYVCGITPYDSTHLGHAATYITFDLLQRVLRDNGHQVQYVQNITDVDDPLFERATRDGVDWRELGKSQIDLFRSDMELLEIFPPSHYVGVMEAIPEVIAMVQRLLDNGAAYVVDDAEYPDIYASITATEQFGYESGYSRSHMEELFAERGGDPDRPGKRDPLDALLWRVHRPGEPAWESPFGLGRPGWHIECSAIATNRLGKHFDIQGGGSDLKFPHHEFSAAHAEAALGATRMADFYVHTGMIGLEGTKMSKSLGNLVFVHKLVAAGVAPAAIRLGLYETHYRRDRDWSSAVLERAQSRLAGLTAALREPGELSVAAELVANIRTHLADDLDTPHVLSRLDEWVNRDRGPHDPAAAALVSTALLSLLGVRTAGQ